MWYGWLYGVDSGHVEPRVLGRTLGAVAPGLGRLLEAPVSQQVVAGVPRQLLPVGRRQDEEGSAGFLGRG